MSLLKVNEVQNYNGSSLALTASTVSTSAQLNTGGNISVTGSINVSDDSTTRSNLGLGSIATQDSDNVTVTGGTATLGALTVSGSDSGDLVRITQTGSGNALVVEDSANPDSTPFVVDASGNVGIGTSSPSCSVNVNNGFIQVDISGTQAVRVGSTDSLVGGTDNEAVFQSNTGKGMRFLSGGSERMRINSSGEVLILKENFGSSGVSNNAGIACTIDQGTNIPAITVSGDSGSFGDIGFGLYSNTGSSWQFYVSYDGEVNYKSLNSLSDIREKQNISDSTIGLNEVLNLKPKTFQWINSQDDKYYFGFAAQDVQEVIPSIVSERFINEEKETRLGINIDQLIPILTKAIQEQQALIESQQSQIDALTARIEALEATP